MEWRLKPDKGMLDYLGGGNSTSSGVNRWATKPSQDVVSYLGEAGPDATAQPTGLETELDAKDFLEAFNEWNKRKEKLWNGGLDVGKVYAMVSEYAPLPKTEREIQALLDLIPDEAANHAGVFISYLVNEVYPYDEIELRTGKPIGKLGTHNTKKRWRIAGDVGNDAGMSMTGGELVIRGNAANSIGWCMKGGKIIVEGNAGKWIGADRKGGEIHISGTYESIWSEKGGAIYHKSELIA